MNALDMNRVAMDAKPHRSHRFGKWYSTIVCCASNDRFGKYRTCKRCGGSEVFAGGAGSHYFDDDLMDKCPGDE